MLVTVFFSDRDAIMKEDPDKPRKIRCKNQEGEEESPASPVTDVSQLLKFQFHHI